MAIREVAQFVQSKLFVSLIFYYEFNKILDMSFRTNILRLPLRRISSVN